MATDASFGIEAVRLAGLDAAALTAAPCTVFVPADSAVAAYAATNPSVTTGLQSSSGKVAIGAHIVPDAALQLRDMQEGQTTFNTVAGTPLIISKTGNSVMVSSGVSTANIIRPNIPIGNAVMHLVDNVLAPVA